MLSGLQIISINKKTDDIYNIRLIREKSDTIIPCVPAEAVYVEVDIKSSYAEKLSVGDSIHIGIQIGYNTFETKGDTCYISNLPSVSNKM